MRDEMGLEGRMDMSGGFLLIFNEVLLGFFGVFEDF